MKDIAIAIPVLGRQYHIDPLLKSIHDTTPNARVVFITSTNDKSGAVGYLKRIGEEVLELEPKLVKKDDKVWNFADYSRKINLAFRHTKEPLFFTGATDLKFTHGWFDAATKEINGDVQCIGTKDGFNPAVQQGIASTHTLITREYGERGTVDDPDCVLHEGSWHEWVDVEMIETAKVRNAFVSSRAKVLHVNRRNDIHYNNVRMRMLQGIGVWEDRRHLLGDPQMPDTYKTYARYFGWEEGQKNEPEYL